MFINYYVWRSVIKNKITTDWLNWIMYSTKDGNVKFSLTLKDEEQAALFKDPVRTAQ